MLYRPGGRDSGCRRKRNAVSTRTFGPSLERSRRAIAATFSRCVQTYAWLCGGIETGTLRNADGLERSPPYREAQKHVHDYRSRKRTQFSRPASSWERSRRRAANDNRRFEDDEGDLRGCVELGPSSDHRLQGSHTNSRFHERHAPWGRRHSGQRL